MHEAWQNIRFIFFVCSTLSFQRRDWIPTMLVNLQSRCSFSFCIFCTNCSANISKHTECSQNILILYRTFTVNLVMYRMFRNAVRCLDVKQRHLNLPLLFIINEVDKRVLLWYKLSITEGIGNTFFSFQSVIKLLDCTFPWIWRTIKIDLFFCYLHYKKYFRRIRRCCSTLFPAWNIFKSNWQFNPRVDSTNMDVLYWLQNWALFLGVDFFISWTVSAATNFRNGPAIAVDVVASCFWLEIYSYPIDCWILASTVRERARSLSTTELGRRLFLLGFLLDSLNIDYRSRS